MLRRRIMMVSSEVSPWARSGGLADVLGALPAALAAQGYEVAVVVPRYMNAADSPTSLLIDGLRVPFGASDIPINVWAGSNEIGSGSVTLYFIENKELFGSEGRGSGLYGNQQGDYPDNHIRFAVFSRAALEISRRIFHADVFHCHDWQAALLPVYLRETLAGDPDLAGTKTLFTIHNLGYQGLFPPSALGEIGLPPHLFNPEQLEFWGRINFLKAGIVFSDAISTVSRRYAEEIQTEPFGFGLDGLLRHRSAVLSGILNGVDYTRWNPATDPHIAANYDPDNLAGKLECKRALLREMELPDSMMDRPLIGVVSRFAVQKGFDLLAPVAERIFARGSGLVVLGDGDADLEQMFLGLARDFPGQAAIRLGFNDPLAHRIEAGADLFLMPSRYEPCGLNQIYSLKYGTVPVVRATGGLDDTIDESTGFKFHDYNGDALLDAVAWACDAWENREEWAGRMVRGMRKDFSWEPSARAYSELYQRL